MIPMGTAVYLLTHSLSQEVESAFVFPSITAHLSAYLNLVFTVFIISIIHLVIKALLAIIPSFVIILKIHFNLKIILSNLVLCVEKYIG